MSASPSATTATAPTKASGTTWNTPETASQTTKVERNPHGKKLGNQQDQFEKILHKQCPVHPKSNHTLFQCISFRESLNAPLPD
jgi:hypothetical protein